MKARQIAACYRRDEAHDPELFAGQLALVLGEYSREIVEYAADPRSGVANSYKMGLPQVPQIKDFLDAAVAHAQRVQHYAKLPRFHSNRDALPPPERATMFIANVVSDFDKMWERHIQSEKKIAREETRLCVFDGQQHFGLWVPPEWWEQRKAELNMRQT